MSRDGTVTGHKEVTLKSETGSFDEHAEVIQAQKLCEGEKTPGGTLNNDDQRQHGLAHLGA